MIFKKLTVKYFCDSEPLNIHMSPDTSTNIMEMGQKQFSNSAKSWRFALPTPLRIILKTNLKNRRNCELKTRRQLFNR